MRQEINFYRGSTRPQVPPFGAQWILGAAAVLLALLTLISSSQWMGNRSLDARLLAVNRQAEELDGQVKALQLRFPEPKTDPALVAEADRLQRRVQELEYLLDSVQEDGTVRRGFSEFFQALARQTIPGVWLTAIHFSAGGEELELQGKALNAQDIPRLVQALGQERPFKAKAFSALTISRPEQQPGQVEFVLRTHLPKKEGER